MGRVIFVPAAFVIDHPQELNYYGSGHEVRHICPVELSSNVYGVVSGSVTVKINYNSEYIEPLNAVTEFYQLNAVANTNVVRVRRNDTSFSSTAWTTMTRDDVRKAFWDHTEIVDEVANWYGDLILQITQYGWVFCPTDRRDKESFDNLLKRHRHCFDIPVALRDSVIEWLNNNGAEYDYHKAENFATKDIVYVRSNQHAVHFKLRWYGQEPEDEMVN